MPYLGEEPDFGRIKRVRVGNLQVEDENLIELDVMMRNKVIQ